MTAVAAALSAARDRAISERMYAAVPELDECPVRRSNVKPVI